MSKLQYFDYEGFGEQMKEHVNYSQAVRIGDKIEISGQGTLFSLSGVTSTNRKRWLGSHYRRIS